MGLFEYFAAKPQEEKFPACHDLRTQDVGAQGRLEKIASDERKLHFQGVSGDLYADMAEQYLTAAIGHADKGDLRSVNLFLEGSQEGRNRTDWTGLPKIEPFDSVSDLLNLAHQHGADSSLLAPLDRCTAELKAWAAAQNVGDDPKAH